MKTPKYLVVIGASAGGFKAVDQLIRGLDPSDEAAYCISLHFSDPDIGKYFVKRVQSITTLPSGVPTNEEQLAAGSIYIAPPGKQMIIKDDRIELSDLSDHILAAQTIDILFRSAAAAFGSRCIGIVLTGMMHDGVQGMNAIKNCGGTCIVQDPEEAEYSELPTAVLNLVKVQHQATLSQMGRIVKETIENKVVRPVSIPTDLQAEIKETVRMAAEYKQAPDAEERSSYTCPECGSPLFKTMGVNGNGTIHNGNGITHYYCKRGHTFSEGELMFKQIKNAESAIWVAVRIMEERKHLLVKLADECHETLPNLAADYRYRALSMDQNIDALKNMLAGIKQNGVEV